MTRFLIVLSVGIIGMLLCAVSRRKTFSLNIFQSVLFTLLLTGVGVAGAKLLYAVENGFNDWSGISFYGSVFLIPLLMPVTGTAFRLRPRQSLDICAPCVAIMIACMRINCFLSGCCGGLQARIGSLCFNWPTQMMESFFDVLILWWLLRQEESGSSCGRLYPLFMICYSVMRFFIEFLRDTPKVWFLMSHGQWFALIAIISGVLWLRCLKRN